MAAAAFLPNYADFCMALAFHASDHGYDIIKIKTVRHLDLTVLRILKDVTLFSLKFLKLVLRGIHCNTLGCRGVWFGNCVLRVIIVPCMEPGLREIKTWTK